MAFEPYSADELPWAIICKVMSANRLTRDSWASVVTKPKAMLYSVAMAYGWSPREKFGGHQLWVEAAQETSDVIWPGRCPSCR
jgi:hypothetical protein